MYRQAITEYFEELKLEKNIFLRILGVPLIIPILLIVAYASLLRKR